MLAYRQSSQAKQITSFYELNEKRRRKRNAPNKKRKHKNRRHNFFPSNQVVSSTDYSIDDYEDENNDNKIIVENSLNINENKKFVSKNIEPSIVVNKYELDWYFLDKQGQMNIIR